MIKLKNQYLTVKVNEMGAELSSVINEDGIEYLWTADSNYWGRHAPILFPFIGKSKDDQYTYDGHTYNMASHGFARDLVFNVVSNDDQQVILELDANNITKIIYPFNFKLRVKYQLVDHSVNVTYRVINDDSKEMLFSIGGHPGFNVPLVLGTDFEDYFVKFSPNTIYRRIPLEPPYSNPDKMTTIDFTQPMPLDHELFSSDALVEVLDGNQTSVMIGSNKTEHGILLTIDNAPYIGVWSPYPKQAPFLCLEPWWGIADTQTASGNLADKYAINKLAPNSDFLAEYKITLF